MLLCPACNWPTSRVLSSRDSARTIRRRRECLRCGERWATVEVVRDDLPAGLDPDVGRRSPGVLADERERKMRLTG